MEQTELIENKDGSVTMITTVENNISSDAISSEIGRIAHEKERYIRDMKLFKERYDKLVILEAKLKKLLLKSDGESLELLDEVDRL